MLNDPGILKIIEYVSMEIHGWSDGTGGDVEIKYLAEDEKQPYWWIGTESKCWPMKEIEELNKVVEDAGFCLTICKDGFWVKEKQIK